MATAASTLPRVEEERYLALLRAANAIATAGDCNTASDLLVKKLREVTCFNSLHVVVFDKETNLPCWSLLEVNGEKTAEASLADLSSDNSPIGWVHE